MKKRVLITGGAGFVGSHVADELLEAGYEVRALDNLSVQVHGHGCLRPDYLNDEVELIIDDLRDPAAVRSALHGIDAVFHFGAKVGVGQSMYEVSDYVSTNHGGTAVLLQALIERPVERLVVASSMSIYGEGLYQAPDGQLIAGQERPREQLKAHEWELRNDRGEVLSPIATPETKSPALSSVYALSKYDQERLCLLVGRAYSIPTVGLRFFNIYGTRQSLSNPYTGVLAIFASRLMNDRSPMIFEDGYQIRDFVSVKDIAQACRLALEVPEAGDKVFNIGSGEQFTVRDIAARLARVMGKEHIEPEITQSYRIGDIRHCFADISQAQRILGYEPAVALDDGLEELAGWLEGQTVSDRFSEASNELSLRGLTV